MKIKSVSGLGICLVILSVLLLSSCVITFGNPVGRVINVKNGNGIQGATVTLTYQSGADSQFATPTSYSANTDASGEFFIAGVTPGRYELTASRTGYAFTREIVNVTGSGYTFPDIGGFVPGVYDAMTIFVFWSDKFKDVDAHLTYPNFDATGGGAGPVFLPLTTGKDFYTHDPYGTYTQPGSGFYPDVEYSNPEAIDAGTAQGREHIYYPESPINYKTGTDSLYPGIPSAELEVDNFGADGQNPGGPETIVVRYSPFTTTAIYNSYTSTGTGDPSGLPSGNYRWVGVMEYYLHAYVSGTYLSQAGSPDSADAVVYVFEGTNQVGRYVVPTFTQVKTASVLRINMFKKAGATGQEDWFQILPDIRTVSTIRGMEGNGIIAIKGKFIN